MNSTATCMLLATEASAPKSASEDQAFDALASQDHSCRGEMNQLRSVTCRRVKCVVASFGQKFHGNLISSNSK